MFVVRVLLGMSAASLVGAQHGEEQQCPADWEDFKGNCYHFYDEERNWDTAKEFCQSQKADIATAKNQAESDYLVEKTRDAWGTKMIHLNGRYDYHRKQWVWEDTYTRVSAYAWSNWAYEDKKTFGKYVPEKTGDHCLAMYTGARSDSTRVPQTSSMAVKGTWNVVQCQNGKDSGFKVMCMKQRNLCPDGWDEFRDRGARGRCYHFHLNLATPLPWHQASDACRAEGDRVTIASAESEEQNRWMHLLITKRAEDENQAHVWLGATDNAKEGTWVWQHNMQAVHWNMWWRVHGCQATSSGCQKTCLDDDWKQFEDHCYTMAGTNDWEGAKRVCDGYSGSKLIKYKSDVTSCESQAEATFLAQLLHGAPTSMYLNAQDSAEEGKWKWQNGKNSDVSWVSWAPGYPNGGAAANCLFLQVNSKQMTDKKCDFVTSVVCKMPALPVTHGENGNCLKFDWFWWDADCSEQYDYVCQMPYHDLRFGDFSSRAARASHLTPSTTCTVMSVAALCAWRVWLQG